MIGCAVHALGEVDSTQAEVSRRAAQGAPEGTVVTARHQTEGRGRLGRRWWDQPGGSLLLSVLLTPSIPLAQAPQLSLVAGLAVVDALAAAARVAARIRWPNDVLLEGRKVCGILCEAITEGQGGLRQVILGIGINVDQMAFPDELRDRATSLRLATGVSHDQGHLLGELLEALDRRYGEWLRGGFSQLRDAWRLASCTLGESVPLAEGREGVAVDVDDTGALLVRGGDGVMTRVVSGAPGERASGRDREGVRHAARD